MTLEETEVFVCINIDCKSRGAEAVLRGLKDRLECADAASVRIKPYVCFSACNIGPNLVIPARRCWLSGVQVSDLDAVVSYIGGGDDVPRLKQQNDPDLEQLIFDIIDAGLVPAVDRD